MRTVRDGGPVTATGPMSIWPESPIDPEDSLRVEQGLVDEFRLMVFPIVLGQGKQLFGDTGTTRALELVESRSVGPDGVLVLVYRPK